MPNSLVNNNDGVVDRGRQVWDVVRDSIIWHSQTIENNFWQQRHPACAKGHRSNPNVSNGKAIGLRSIASIRF